MTRQSPRQWDNRHARNVGPYIRSNIPHCSERKYALNLSMRLKHEVKTFAVTFDGGFLLVCITPGPRTFFPSRLLHIEQYTAPFAVA